MRQARDGSARALGRLLTLVEEQRPSLREALRLLAGTGDARVVGLTGPPGAGKSTAAAALVRIWRAQGLRVGVLAVDPSSPFSGGALLGDRVRMTEHALDPEVFVRSMASRGHLGGLSAAVPQAVRVLSATGFDRVLVETVGVGQNEVEIAAAADTTVVLLAPGMGDGIQAAKAGILEVGDVLVVNKADRDGARRTARDLRAMLAVPPGGSADREGHERAWRPPVVLTVATTGEGVEELATAVAAHGDHLARHGHLQERRRARAATEVAALTLGALQRRVAQLPTELGVDAVADAVLRGELDPYDAAEQVAAALVTPEAPTVRGQ